MNDNHTLPCKPLSVNSFRISQPLGGILALQGIYRSMPIIHGSQGCAEAIKALLAKHFREPISLQNIPIDDYNLIFGGSKSVHNVLDLVITEYQPDIVTIIGTSLTEVVGEDLSAAVKYYKKQTSNLFHDKLLLTISIPDYTGSMESGYAKTTEAILRGIIELAGNVSRKKHRDRINLLIGPHLTPGDVMEIKEIITSFGLEVIAVPDLSSSLGGHLLTGHTSLSRGGIPLDQLMDTVTSGFTIAVGSCMEQSAKLIKEAFDIPYRVFPGLMGLKASDQFFRFLQQYSKNPVQVKYRWQRQYLLDSMLDTSSVYRGKRVVAALEPDHLASLFEWFSEMGIKTFHSVTTSASPVLNKFKEHVQIGDLEELEKITENGADLWISNSYGEQGARRKGISFVPSGFPIINQYGSSLEVSVGYKGTTEQIYRIANVLSSTGRRMNQ